MTNDDDGLKFSLRLSGDAAAQVRRLAELRATTPYRVVKDVLNSALPAVLTEEPSLPQRMKALQEGHSQLSQRVAEQASQLQAAIDAQLETLSLLRRVSEALTGAPDQHARESLWREVNKECCAARANAHPENAGKKAP